MGCLCKCKDMVVCKRNFNPTAGCHLLCHYESHLLSDVPAIADGLMNTDNSFRLRQEGVDFGVKAEKEAVTGKRFIPGEVPIKPSILSPGIIVITASLS